MKLGLGRTLKLPLVTPLYAFNLLGTIPNGLVRQAKLVDRGGSSDSCRLATRILYNEFPNNTNYL